MNNKQLWIDILQGMRNRATQLYSDSDGDGRNENWYARETYGDLYEKIREKFQKQMVDEGLANWMENDTK